MFYRDPEFAHF